MKYAWARQNCYKYMASVEASTVITWNMKSATSYILLV